MKPQLDLHPSLHILNQSFVSIPYALLSRMKNLSITHLEFVVLLQIIGSVQVNGSEILSAQALSELSGVTEREAGDVLNQLMEKNLLAIVTGLDEKENHTLVYSLVPLWEQLQSTNKTETPPVVAEAEKDLVTLFEGEFGRLLSGLECDQIRQWLDDGVPTWLLTEALREAVLANKCSFRYMDRILYDWQRHRIRSRQELDAYRQSYRERQQAREETAVSTQRRRNSSSSKDRDMDKRQPGAGQRDERYSAFYELFPDS